MLVVDHGARQHGDRLRDLFGLTPADKLVVFAPDGKEYKEIASYKVAPGDTYAYPVISGNRIFVKDKDSLTLWMVE